MRRPLDLHQLGDGELVERYLAGDERAATALWDRYSGLFEATVSKSARSSPFDEDEVRDVAYEVFLGRETARRYDEDRASYGTWFVLLFRQAMGRLTPPPPGPTGDAERQPSVEEPKSEEEPPPFAARMDRLFAHADACFQDGTRAALWAVLFALRSPVPDVRRRFSWRSIVVALVAPDPGLPIAYDWPETHDTFRLGAPFQDRVDDAPEVPRQWVEVSELFRTARTASGHDVFQGLFEQDLTQADELRRAVNSLTTWYLRQEHRVGRP